MLINILFLSYLVGVSFARYMDTSDEDLDNRAVGAAQYVNDAIAEPVPQEGLDDAEVDDNDEQRDEERRQSIPSGSFHGACFFDDAFGRCPRACRKDGHPRGGKCKNFKCKCY